MQFQFKVAGLQDQLVRLYTANLPTPSPGAPTIYSGMRTTEGS